MTCLETKKYINIEKYSMILKVKAVVFLIFLTFIIQGCTVGPDYVIPDTEMPDAWNQELTRGLTDGQADMQTWWFILDDPILDDLIEKANEGNLDLKTAMSRINQARAQLGIRVSENGLLAPPSGNVDQTNLHRAGLDSTWEIDVFGRISRSVESASANLDASIENYRDIMIILYSEVALNYIQVRSLQARIQYAQNNIKLQKGTLQLTKDRLKAGLVPELDVEQAKLNLANTESVIPSLRSRKIQAINRLSVLIGQPPGQLEELMLNAQNIPDINEEIIVGLPAELLRQRPDIRSAERNLAAQTAQVGVATADLYPSFSLSGTFALEAQNLDDMDNWDSRTWGFGPAFRWNLFDGDRIRSNIRFQEALTEELLLQYEQTVLLALEEVENAMVAYKEEQIRLEATERSVVAAQKSVELVDTLYRSGLTDFQNVLDMQRSLSIQQDQLAESEGFVVQNLIRIYKSLGGGWSIDSNQLAKAK
jgi:NodT family efflux transporter outer membrane factor (OMF) lipoprotein